MTLSHTTGLQAPPLLEETIGDNLDATVGAVRRPRGAGRRARTGRRWTYAELVAEVDRLARGLLAPGVGQGRPGRASGRRTAPSGRSCSTPRRRSARSWSTSTRPTARTSWPTCCSQAGISMLVVGRRRSRPATTARWSPRSRGELPDALGASSSSAPGRGTTLLAGADDVTAEQLAAGAGEPSTRRPDQHPVHVGHHRLPQGRDAHPPQHPQQRLLRRRGVPLHRGRPGLHPGAVLPLLRHGHGQPRRPPPTAPAMVIPAPGVRPGGDARRRSPNERCTSLYGVPTMFIAEWALADFATYDLSSLRTGIMAGSPCPVEVMKQVIDAWTWPR